ncbi:MAG: HNH nuclease family protein [Deltaproteobacteria bacterium]|nr:HNH nuclease family protein [Deltaproteobacteria bacterium]
MPDDKFLQEAKAAIRERGQSYRGQAMKLFPPICGRCGREFSGKRLRELTVHHKDHNHDNNPPDGSNWELLCVYCHDNEHQRELEHVRRGGHVDLGRGPDTTPPLTHRPFANLAELLKDKVRK